MIFYILGQLSACKLNNSASDNIIFRSLVHSIRLPISSKFVYLKSAMITDECYSGNLLKNTQRVHLIVCVC